MSSGAGTRALLLAGPHRIGHAQEHAALPVVSARAFVATRVGHLPAIVLRDREGALGRDVTRDREHGAVGPPVLAVERAHPVGPGRDERVDGVAVAEAEHLAPAALLVAQDLDRTRAALWVFYPVMPSRFAMTSFMTSSVPAPMRQSRASRNCRLTSYSVM